MSEFNQDNNNKKGNRLGGGSDEPPKFNYYWIYGFIALLLLGLNFYQFSNANAKDLDWGSFK